MRGYFVLSAIVVFTANSCSQASSSHSASATHDRYDVLFAKDAEAMHLPIPIGEGAAKVCASEAGMMRMYPGRGIMAVTGAVPFSPSKQSDHCNIEISYNPTDGRSIFESKLCQVRIIQNGRLQISPKNIMKSKLAASESQFILAECFYRVALVSEGFTNGMAAPIFGEFPSDVHFIGKRSYVGSIVTPFIRELTDQCPKLKESYYKAALQRDVARCL